jgi:hypothetical protein
MCASTTFPLQLFEYLLQQGADPSILSYPSPDPDLYTVHGRAALPLQVCVRQPA